MKHIHTLIWGCAVLLLCSSCEGFWGTRTDTDFLDEPVFDGRTVAYVPIQPVWDNLDFPVDVIAGWDELIYVADQGRELIVSFDQAGNELGTFAVPGLTAIAQDRRLDILALGTRDTILNGTPLTLAAVYRIDLDKTGTYGLENARIKNILTHPFYARAGTPSSTDLEVRFTGIAPLGDNRFFVARTGTSNNPNQFGGPDQAVLLFDPEDNFVSPVNINTNLGLFRDYFKDPRGIATFAQPPQSPAVSRQGDFIFTSLGEDASLRVQVIDFVESDFGASFEVRNLLAGDTSRAERFLYEPQRWSRPVDATIAGDGTNYFFVVDADLDSLYQFNSLGFEGVNPPPGSRTNKAILASFGGTGEGLTQFNEPRGVAYLSRIVYVADAGNGRILRFRLTTDFE